MTVGLIQQNKNIYNSAQYTMTPDNKTYTYIKPEWKVQSPYNNNIQKTIKSTIPNAYHDARNNQLGIIKNLLTGIAVTAAIVLGAGVLCKNAKKIQYLCKNFGNKGINDFSKINKNKNTENIFQFLEKTPELKRKFNKIGVKNLEEIATFLKIKGVKDLLTQKAEINMYVSKTNGCKVTPIINFSSKDGFDLYNEIERASHYCEFLNRISENIENGHKKYPAMFIKQQIMNNTSLKMEKMTQRLEITNQENGWLVNLAKLDNSSSNITLYKFFANDGQLKTLCKNPDRSFGEFLNLCNNTKDSAIMLQFNNFTL